MLRCFIMYLCCLLPLRDILSYCCGVMVWRICADKLQTNKQTNKFQKTVTDKCVQPVSSNLECCTTFCWCRSQRSVWWFAAVDWVRWYSVTVSSRPVYQSLSLTLSFCPSLRFSTGNGQLLLLMTVTAMSVYFYMTVSEGWKILPRTKWPETRTLDHYSQVCKKPAEGFRPHAGSGVVRNDLLFSWLDVVQGD